MGKRLLGVEDIAEEHHEEGRDQDQHGDGNPGGYHSPLKYNPRAEIHDDHNEEWTHARGLGPPAQQATAALRAAGEDLGDIIALAQLAGFRVEADQTNAPWGSDNVSEHPPQKPYGATEKPNPDVSPASYGFLSAPDPENWGSIDQDSAMQMPLTNTGSRRVALSSPEHKVLAPGAPDPLPAGLNYPSITDQNNQGTFGYADQANTAGPSTAMDPRDPQGIRMEESLDPAADADEFHRHLVEMHGQPDVPWLRHDYTKHSRDHEDADRARELGEPLEYYTGFQPHPYHELDHEYRHSGAGSWPDAYTGSKAELHGDHEPALDPDGLTADMGDQSVAEGLTGGAQEPSPVTQEPGMGSGDEYLTPQDSSIQTVGAGMGTDSDEVAVPADQPQEGVDAVVAAFQHSAAAGQYSDGAQRMKAGAGGGPGDHDIAQAAAAFLKTADVLPDHEAAELISEGRGQRARNLALLRLEGTHYEEEDAELARRGLSLDDYDDDVVSA